MSDISPPTQADHEEARLRRLELEEAARDHVSRLHGARELQAAVLALLLPARSKRALRAWKAEIEGVANPALLFEHLRHLQGPARLPCLEMLVKRMRGQPLDARQVLLEATRRVMSARGSVRPIDRLHWLAMRQWLGEGSGAAHRAPAVSDLSQLPQADVSAIAMYSAFLSRLVPVEAAASRGELDALETTPGTAWYDTVMTAWQSRATVPVCRAPDSDGLVHALQTLQALAWMQRPMLVRGWVTAAQSHSQHGRLSEVAADALRLSCVLLDSPLSPELARHYGEGVPGEVR